MARIKQLPLHEAQKIAAGEVVERPANIVKELFENSIDAGATQITLYLQNGGKDTIRIIDNGHGMSCEDARLCIEHHATSKITSVDELSHITTFGFRGEALSSIAAISKMILITKEDASALGTKLTIEAGTILQEELISSNTGTEIIINDIFYNVPARKKFLKTKETEWRAIVQLVHALCLDYPYLAVKMYHDNNLSLHCPSTQTLSERSAQLFDDQCVRSLITCSTEIPEHKLTIQGVITTPPFGRYDRNHLYFFVNNRWVKNYKLTQALLKGYGRILPDGRFPVACILISLDTQQVDINIHPRKEEVQFMHPRIIEQALETMVKKHLEEKIAQHLHKTISLPPSHDKKPLSIPHAPSPSHTLPLQKPLSTFIPAYAHQPPSSIKMAEGEPVLRVQSNLPLPWEDDVTYNNIVIPSYTLIGQLHATYLQLETEEGLVMVDQHAAHERILYEQFGKRFDAPTSINLLFPEIITLSRADYTLFIAHYSLLQEYGIIMEPAGPQEFCVKSVPAFLKNHSMHDLVHYFINLLQETAIIETDKLTRLLHEKLRAQMACKAAVKAGDTLTTEKMHELIKQLYTTENRSTCPHGRPTTWLISQYEIEKKFKRKG